MTGMAPDPWDPIVRHLEALDGIRAHAGSHGVARHGRGRRWCVANRLVARQLDTELLLIRCDFGLREQLLVQHPETFSVRPSLEAHQKVIADVVAGDPGAITAALDAAWEMQRAPR